MSAEDKLQALEQLVTVMQSEVLLARAIAAQAEQRVTDAETRSFTERGEGVVDTRFLGKRKSFDATSDSWRQFKFTFLGYARAVDMRFKQAIIESEVLAEAIANTVLLPRDQRVSTQLYYMLVLLLEGSAHRLLEHGWQWRRTAELAQACGRVRASDRRKGSARADLQGRRAGIAGRLRGEGSTIRANMR